MIHLFRDLTPDEEQSDPDATRVTGGTPRASNWKLFEGGDGQVSGGTWTCSPGRWRINYDETEYCHILEGSGIIHVDGGSPVEIGAGDEFFISAGLKGEWEVLTTMTKRYIIVLPVSAIQKD